MIEHGGVYPVAPKQVDESIRLMLRSTDDGDAQSGLRPLLQLVGEGL